MNFKDLGHSWDSGMCTNEYESWKIIDLGGPTYLREDGLEEESQFNWFPFFLNSKSLGSFFWKSSGNWECIGSL